MSQNGLLLFDAMVFIDQTGRITAELRGRQFIND